ncbi:hypothetical protein K432DRAFT_131269 [Lepidopterella palustris CBS 459.81]|uniref:Uncharacterized protein n=1 Tax=Lepidopterella palustris CBS 459.81 TaxID=1314670 RepID=A0A8E2EI69_9PEZI|nr:hypothetical protein K432DRAFT_131269 [Lepidopterella palustris CBS 459.81]
MFDAQSQSFYIHPQGPLTNKRHYQHTPRHSKLPTFPLAKPHTLPHTSVHLQPRSTLQLPSTIQLPKQNQRQRQRQRPTPTPTSTLPR